MNKESLNQAQPESNTRWAALAPMSPAATVTGTAFLLAMFAEIAQGHHTVICAIPGDPEKADRKAWAGRPWWPGRTIPRSQRERFLTGNAYLTISSFHALADGYRPRRKENFAAMHAVMIDDIATKVPLDRANRLPLSALVETSPGNFQGWLFLQQDSDSRDRDIAARLLDRMIAAGLTSDGADPGMRGVTRLGRLPIGVNGKAKYVERLGAPFAVRCWEFDPDRRYSIREIAEAFALDMRAAPAQPPRAVTRAEALAALDAFEALLWCLGEAELYDGQPPSASGWIEIRCPFEDEHSAITATGTALAVPSEANEWAGGFVCHHGHCSGAVTGQKRTLGDVWRLVEFLLDADIPREEPEWSPQP
jgi:RepB DNA-primase N-terminal domain